MRKALALTLALSGVAGAQNIETVQLNVPLAAGTLSIRNVGPSTHAFVPITVDGQTRTNVPLTLQSPPVFSISNLGGNSGWSVTLSETHSSSQNLGLDYIPGAGTVIRTVGRSRHSDLRADSALAGNSLSAGRKVLSARARSNLGVFQYSLSSSQWRIPLIQAGTRSGSYSWTLQATLSARP